MHKDNTQTSHKKITSKQVVAWIGILLLIALYITTLLAALFDNSASGSLFASCLYATVAVPLLIWIYAWIYQKVKEQKDQQNANQTEAHQP